MFKNKRESEINLDLKYKLRRSRCRRDEDLLICIQSRKSRFFPDGSLLHDRFCNARYEMFLRTVYWYKVGDTTIKACDWAFKPEEWLRLGERETSSALASNNLLAI
jgi:hypothetical protein